MRSIAILLVLAVAAIAAPISIRIAVANHARYKQASYSHFHLNQQARELREYSEEVSEYGRFADRVERFISNARAAGIAEEGWNRHHVDIQNRVVSFARLGEFLAEAKGGENYYFLPSTLRIQTGVGGSGTNSFRRRTAATPADGVRVDLVGDFLVPVQ